MARAFLVDSDPLQIVLCSNRLKTSEVEEVVTHELVHAFDYTYSRCNFDSCEGLAYSEVRAAREAECANTSAFPFQLSWFKSQCIRYHASRSTSSLFPSLEAAKCVDTVLSAAMSDLAPFDGSYKIQDSSPTRISPLLPPSPSSVPSDSGK